MTKQIKIGETLLTVLEVYPYMYQNNKEVIRVKVSEENHTYSDIEVLKENTDTIEYLEDDVKKNDYTGYTEDYRTTFYNGVWSIELTRKTEEQRTIEMHEAAIVELAAMIAEVGQGTIEQDSTLAGQETEEEE